MNSRNVAENDNVERLTFIHPYRWTSGLNYGEGGRGQAS